MLNHFHSFIEQSIKRDWEAPALTDIGGETMTYGEMAQNIARLHLLFKDAGLKKGDRVALCGRNCSNWAIAFLAVSTYEAVAVPVLQDFSAESIHTLVNHSEAKMLFAGPYVWEKIDVEKMPALYGVISLQNFTLLESQSDQLTEAFGHLSAAYDEKYPAGFGPVHVNYRKDNLDDLCVINYTSGTSGSPKGVMLTYRSLSSNVEYGQRRIPNKAGWNVVSMLPLAHMFGLTFEVLYQLAGGCHIFFLSKTPTPQILLRSFADVHPYMILTVPLVIEKIFKKAVLPVVHKPSMKVLMNTPGVGRLVKNKIRNKLLTTLGGNLHYLIIGGAAVNQEVEACMKDIRFPYTVGYGMTECGPLLAYEDWFNFSRKSCGKIVDRMEVTIDSEDPHKKVGEILVKGDNVMLGYYKNVEATAAAFTKEGWMRTGDLGLLDRAGNIYIKGRSKSMILGASGQNIYPEEIEDRLNSLPGVAESVVLERDKRLVALVYPEVETPNHEVISSDSLKQMMDQNLSALNSILPTFSRIFKIELVQKEFEKTPKRSIKRFLYR